MKSARVALITDSAFARDERGHIYPLRDRFPAFATHLAPHVGRLTFVARCRTDVPEDPAMRVNDLPVSDTVQFSPLPYYPNTEASYRRRPSLLRRTKSQLGRAISESDIVILRLHHAFARLAFTCARDANRPVVLYWAGPPIRASAAVNYAGSGFKSRVARAVARLEERQERWIARRADAHLFLDEAEHRAVGSPEPTTWIAPNLIEETAIARTESRREGAEPLAIVFVGRLVHHKGADDLVTAVRMLHQAGVAVTLSIVGDGPERDRLEARTHADKLPVRFTGHLGFEDVRDALKRAHVLALPSYAEGVPKVMWEAWAAGVVPVMSNVGGIARYLEDGTNGKLVPPGDPTALAGALHTLVDDEPSRRAMARHGLRLARAYTVETTIRSIVATLTTASIVHAGRAAP